MKLFRKVRHKLIDEGNLKRYILYAIGEILLVMVGILLALQVNNWNQGRTESKKEQKIIVDLIEEFRLSKDRIVEKQNKRISIDPSLQNYINQLSSGVANYDAFKVFHKLDFLPGMTNPSNGVIDAMTAAGELSLISNDSLKYLLSDWKDQVGNLKENEEILWKVSLEYKDYYQQYIADPTFQWKDWDDKRLNKTFDNLQSKIQYRNMLMSFQGCNTIVIEECKSILDSVDKIIKLLEAEIDKS